MSKETKQILVVRKDLNMRKGKIAAQCAHASMKVLLDLMRISPCGNMRALSTSPGSPLDLWLNNSFAKICVYVNSEEELDALHAEAQEACILSALIVDSGRTEFHGVPTKTVLAIGPDFCDVLDPITGKLPLL